MRDLVRQVHWQWVPVVLVIGYGVWLRDGPVVALVILLGGFLVGIGLEVRAKRRRERRAGESHREHD